MKKNVISKTSPFDIFVTVNFLRFFYKSHIVIIYIGFNFCIELSAFKHP